jgi:phosphoserine phosphatase
MSIELREPGWTAENRARLERMLNELGQTSGRRVAVFDWDNTMMRGDIGDLVLASLLERSMLEWPEEFVRDGRPTFDHLELLTDAARVALDRACGDTALRGEPGRVRLATGDSECGRVLAHIAWNGTLPEGEPAFTISLAPFYRATYGFMAQLTTANRTDEDLREFTRLVWQDASAAPLDSSRRVFGIEVDRYARLHLPMIELAHALERVGVEVWFVSASSQAMVETMAENIGFSRTRVIGVRVEHDANGRNTTRFEACGEGPLGTPVMTWNEGKRAWIAKVIFGLPTESQRPRQSDPALRPVFVAGDSDGDLAMLEDATHLRLVLDRQNPRVMCNALSDPSGWIVQPLFVNPMPPRSEPYPCATFRDPLGPIRDEHGRPIEDQRPR